MSGIVERLLDVVIDEELVAVELFLVAFSNHARDVYLVKI